ncbi:YMR118C [Saccharomyces arboricola H-6]|uniref:YMR118C n=1 Tax=Saccharomyces arboricola (strain H-6 / AS 2.3317 / CBS 10644) TaxID=1160507 RepID=J8Q3H8_SACAR|nr:YMR118C [Saccharomyces arboricola H-6]
MRLNVHRISALLKFHQPNLFVPGVSTQFLLRNQTFNGLLARRFHGGCISNSDHGSCNGEEDLLISQRKQRPISPHLTIYEPEMSWYLSSLHRISGVLLALGFYVFTVTLGVTTILGIDLTFQDLNKWYHEKLPKWSQLLVKGSAGYLFAFHFGNGIRHLVWDMGYELTNPGVIKTGSIVLAGTLILGTYLLTQ